jgi:hypothetical protein
VASHHAWHPIHQKFAAPGRARDAAQPEPPPRKLETRSRKKKTKEILVLDVRGLKFGVLCINYVSHMLSHHAPSVCTRPTVTRLLCCLDRGTVSCVNACGLGVPRPHAFTHHARACIPRRPDRRARHGGTAY